MDKLAKVKAEIERRHEYNKEHENDWAGTNYFWQKKEDEEILSFIDSMQKEANKDKQEVSVSGSAEDDKITELAEEYTCYGQSDFIRLRTMLMKFYEWQRQNFSCPHSCPAYKDGFRNGKDEEVKKNREELERLKEWFEDVAEKCEHLTSGNVSHNGRMIRGFARNCAEYIKRYLL